MAQGERFGATAELHLSVWRCVMAKRLALSLAFASLLVLPAARSFAQERDSPPIPVTRNAAALAHTGPLAAAAAHQVELLVAVADRNDRQAEARPAEGGNWISRHPVLFSTMVGAGGGAVAAATMENELFCSGGDEDCVFHGGGRVLAGAGMGAGIGALVGVIVSAVSH
jgi:hypothetical protein